jgi:hypothetical protein
MTQIMFHEEALVEKYGSWVRVQVAFYDFLFEAASELCPAHFREVAMESVMAGEWSDGSEFYEVTIDKLEEIFKTQEEAWQAFLEAETDEMIV